MTSFHPAEPEEWGYPFFKILSRNDSGEGRSHLIDLGKIG